jgi:hypothetical protein
VNGPLIAGLLVLAIVVFIAWFSWVGMARPSRFSANVVLLIAIAVLTALLSAAWGLSRGDVILMSLVVPMLVGGAILYVQLRSAMLSAVVRNKRARGEGDR